MIDLLLLCLPQALAYVGNTPAKRWWGFVPTLAGYFVDRSIAHFYMPKLVGRGPNSNERTVSDMLENLCVQEDHPDRQLLLQIALKINRVAGYAHIKSVG